MTETKEAQKVIVLGLDGGSADLIRRFVKERKLPNFEKLIKSGVFKEIIEPLPTITPPNWTTIATGAWPGTHGITDFFLPHEPGDDLDQVNDAFDTRKCQAEYIWEAAERARKKSILIKWECSWPPCHNGIQVEGSGPGVNNFFDLGRVRLHTLRDLPMTSRLHLLPAKDWRNLNPKWEALENEVVIPLHGGAEKVYPILVAKSGNAGYDRVMIFSEKDADRPISQIRMGQWSDWIVDTFDITPNTERLARRDAEKTESSLWKEDEDFCALLTMKRRVREGMMPSGKTKGTFRFKLINLSRDARELELLSTQVFPISGYTQPPELAEELFDRVGPFFTNPAREALHYGWGDERTFYELMDYQHQWLARATKYLSSAKAWDLLYLQTHCADYLSHFYMNQFDTDCGVSEAQVRNATSWFTRHYQSIDRLLGELLSIADDNTLVVVVSDHAGTPSPWGWLDTRSVLEEAGLLFYKVDAGGNKIVDWSKTKAYPQRYVYVYVNLKGRDPHGIVELQDYEKVQEEIIEVLRSAKHPKSGKHAYSLVMKKHEAEFIGLYGDRIGDVVYALRPEADMEHGQELPTARVKDLSLRSVFIMAGPNVKQGVHLKGMAYLTSVAPTIAYLLGIPMPRNAEGAVLYEALIDPDLRLNLQRKAEESSAKWHAMYLDLVAKHGLNSELR
jgi:predicted AlkP superfamily phosphohydrolase/phosphomutase